MSLPRNNDNDIEKNINTNSGKNIQIKKMYNNNDNGHMIHSNKNKAFRGFANVVVPS
jgi:hypothetical protein